jgi:hypothetical protein
MKYYWDDQIKEDRMSRTGMGEMRNVYKMLIGKLKGRDHLKVVGINRR